MSCFSHELSFGLRIAVTPLAVAVWASWASWGVLVPCLAGFLCISRACGSKYPLPILSSGVLAGRLGALLPISAGNALVRVGVDIPVVAYVCLCKSGTGPR